MAVHPEVLWAQRSSATDESKNIVYLTVNLPDIDASTLKYSLEAQRLTFAAMAGDASKKDYSFTIDFYSEIIPEQSSKNLSSRHFYLVLRKKEAKGEYWPRVTKDRTKFPYIKTDFSKVRRVSG
ncbi:HSP20-like chaperone [Aspergillus multicolor]|uniref:p23/wos2 family protein n=1 Tax=Aspergillus multicolor TaxID=41759 RepID=UPI003CCCE40A